MRVLLTAFEPFDGTGLNSSREACRAFLDSTSAREWDLRFVELLVEYGKDTEAVAAALADRPADLLLHTGQASNAAEVRVERLAVNLRYRDRRRQRGGHRPILPDGPGSLSATIPVASVAAAIRTTGLPAVVSHDAGIYLCNHVLYRSLHDWSAGMDGQPGPRVGFLHLPPLPAQDPGHPGAVPPEQLARAIEAALRCLASRPDRDPFAL